MSLCFRQMLYGEIKLASPSVADLSVAEVAEVADPIGMEARENIGQSWQLSVSHLRTFKIANNKPCLVMH